MAHAEQRPNLVKLSESEDLLLEEPWQDIRGLDVMDVNGEQIGSVEDLYLDDREEGLVRAPRFLDVSAGGFLGMGKKHFLVPVEEVTRNVSEEDRVTVNHNRETVLGSPDFDPDDTMPDLSFQRTVYSHYGRPTPEGSSTTKITREQVAAKKGSSDTKEAGESGKGGGDGVVATVAKKAGKGAAKGAVKGAAKEVWRK